MAALKNIAESVLTGLFSGDDQRAEAAVRELAARGMDALPILADLLSDPQPDKRWWAVRVLAEINHPQVAPLLLAALHDADVSVRHCAALALRQQPAPQAIPALIAALESDDPLLARLAGDALIAIGGEAVPPLLEIMQNGPRPARLEAVRALAKIRDHRAILALFTASEDDSALIEYWAEEGLEQMGVGMTFFKPEG